MIPALPDRARRPAAALLLLLLCGVSFFAGSDRPGLLERDECRYSITAREMARSGDLLVPRYNGRERLVKPPATYWAMAASFEATGRFDERSARLPSAIAGTLLVLLVAWGAARVFGAAAGLASGVALATMLQFLLQARLATTDMLFALGFAGASAALVPVLGGSPRPVRWILLSGLLAGLAGLVKTPLAILLPPAAALLAGLLHARLAGPGALPAPLRPGNRGRTLLALGGALAIFAAVFLAWLVPANARTDGRVWSRLVAELTTRVDIDRDVHLGPPWYFVPVILGAALPWTFLAVSGVGAVLRRGREAGGAGAVALFCGLSVDCVFLFFSALPSKLPSYLLPALPFLAVVVGLAVADLARDAARPWERKFAGGAAVAIGALVAGAAALWPERPVAGLPEPGEARTLALAFGALLAVGGAFLLARRTWTAVAFHAAAMLSVVATAGPLLPRIEEARCARSMAAALLEAGMRPEDRLFDVTNHVTGLLWYADRGSETRPDGSAPEERRVIESFASGARTWLVVKDDPEDARRRGRATQWERLRAKLPAGTPEPRVAWRGWERVVVTSVR